ncbi:tyrosyl-tRNA synthetase [Clydaea vesicula]|uniref:Tyrosine--tRNA ligase n=1 Tax=Clydaea vesicula TaxID=447962 RepID=A0AAD5TZ84_9FUNG|nr:tyrosyl-tRNA synthetase [Clydaea vesicula]
MASNCVSGKAALIPPVLAACNLTEEASGINSPALFNAVSLPKFCSPGACKTEYLKFFDGQQKVCPPTRQNNWDIEGCCANAQACLASTQQNGGESGSIVPTDASSTATATDSAEVSAIDSATASANPASTDSTNPSSTAAAKSSAISLNKGFFSLAAMILEKKLLEKQLTIYTGFDPTAKSLHVGNLLPLITLLRFRTFNHNIIALVGGATGAIGDPSGKSTERILQDSETITANTNSIKLQLEKIFKNSEIYLKKINKFNNFNLENDNSQSNTSKVKILNNFEWYRNFTLLDFLKNYGRFGRVNIMIQKDSVKNRLKSEEGISFTEFTYQLLQGYDFFHLHKHHKCNIQLGGSDQWGNIVSGLDIISKISNEGRSKNKIPTKDSLSVNNSDVDNCFGITIPLITNSKGEKFGKSEGNAVWLDENLSSPFEFYQFFRRTSDREIEQFLYYFTFLDFSEIKELVKESTKFPEKQIAQKYLAQELTELVHGEQAAKSAKLKSLLLFEDFQKRDSNQINYLFGEETENNILSTKSLINTFKDDKEIFCRVNKNLVLNKTLLDVLTLNTQAKKIIASGGLYINKLKVINKEMIISKKHIFEENIIIFKIGKTKFKVLELEN